MHLRQQICWSLRCSWSIACRRCSNYISILNLIPGFNGYGKHNCKARWETVKVLGLVRLVLEIWRCNPFLPDIRWVIASNYDGALGTPVMDSTGHFVARIPAQHGYVVGKGSDGFRNCVAAYRDESFECGYDCCEVGCHLHCGVIMSAMASQMTGVPVVCSCFFMRRSKTSKLRITGKAFVGGIHRWPVDFPHKGPVIFLIDDDIIHVQVGLIKWIKTAKLLRIKMLIHRHLHIKPTGVRRLSSLCKAKLIRFQAPDLGSVYIRWRIAS